MTKDEAAKIAQEIGFSHWGFFEAAGLSFRTEVRDMCEMNRCGKYAKRWTCPPGCGPLEAIAEEVKAYSWGILLQTTGEMEDAFDAETMEEAMIAQKERFQTYVDLLREQYRNEAFLPMSSGGCDICKECTYPDAPCRFPEKALPSMEAYGLIVTDVCELAGIPYYYGRNTITYSSCILFP